ncbi:hypothetical protein [Flavobacterium urumqiense]|uniref:Uncharacterized protein n=1 Tax=Flavobacterium urumqiense TaxID=935224 RepID=A0A1H5Z7M8_9FLAO|nr:hypothetical protein [Flavobacterium urumqiense]SEG31376.1 hypothetical protein SAMN04488130_109104 [Flavobacterium urumqiense]
MSKTKFHPILFSTPMVQAIIEGRKTQTRRTKRLESINENPDNFKLLTSFDEPENLSTAFYTRNNGNLYVQFMNGSKNHDIKCPYEMGDVLWVRETFYTFSNWDHWKPRMLKSVNVEVFYTADLQDDYISKPLHRGKTRPNIFLPAAYARIFLKIKSIRVERLQSIDYKEAIKEGIEMKIVIEDGVDIPIQGWTNYLGGDYFTSGDGKNTPEERSFFSLWESINGKESLEQNPFVWVYEFEKIDKPLDFI